MHKSHNGCCNNRVEHPFHMIRKISASSKVFISKNTISSSPKRLVRSIKIFTIQFGTNLQLPISGYNLHNTIATEGTCTSIICCVYLGGDTEGGGGGAWLSLTHKQVCVPTRRAAASPLQLLKAPPLTEIYQPSSPPPPVRREGRRPLFFYLPPVRLAKSALCTVRVFLSLDGRRAGSVARPSTLLAPAAAAAAPLSVAAATASHPG